MIVILIGNIWSWDININNNCRMYVREIKKNSKTNVLSSYAVICNKTLN